MRSSHGVKPTFPERFNLANYYLFDRLEEGLSTKAAVLFGDRVYTYADVAQRARSLARYLRDRGLSEGQRVYIVLPDSPAFVWSLFGVLAAGGVVAMGNPVAPSDDLACVVDYCRPATIVTVPSVVDRLADTLQAAPFIRDVLVVPQVETGQDPEVAAGACAPLSSGPAVTPLIDAIGVGDRLREPLCDSHRDDVCMWLFTSGSTGRPKAAVHTHRDFAFNTEVYAKRTVDYQRDDVTVSVPRLFFGYATGTNLLFPFAVGGTTGLFVERPTPESIAHAIELYQPSVVTNVPTMLGKLLDYDESRTRGGESGLDLSCVRFHLSAGEALPPALLARFTARFGGAVYDGIGSAEMFHIYASNRPGDVKPGSLGRVVDGYEIRIFPADACGPGAAPLPVGETGIMWVRGDSVAQCYHQDRDKSWGDVSWPLVPHGRPVSRR